MDEKNGYPQVPGWIPANPDDSNPYEFDIVGDVHGPGYPAPLQTNIWHPALTKGKRLFFLVIPRLHASPPTA